MLRDEVSKILTYYFSEECTSVHYYGDNDQLLLFQDFLERGKFHQYDSPDSFILLGDMLLIIEHFQFSSYGNSRKGDAQQAELARIERLGNSKTYHETLNIRQNGSSFVGSAIDLFDKHYRKIPKYISNVLKSVGNITISKIYICFLIDDVSIIGSCYLEKESGILRCASLSESREFLEHFQSCSRADWILTGSSSQSEKYPVWFISQKYIQEYLKNSTKYLEKYFPFDEPHVFQWVLTIDKSVNTE